MSMFLKFVSVLVCILGFVLPVVINYTRGNHEKIKKKWAVLGTITALVLFTVSCSFVIIPTGYTGVRTTFGQIDNITIQNGFNWKIPFIQSISKVNNKQQDLHFDSDKIWSETESRTAIFYENVTVTYQINTEKSAWIYANIANYEDTLVSSNIVSSAIKSSSKNLCDSDATNRSIIEPLTMQNLQRSLDEKYGENVVFINKVTISNIDFEDSYNEAIAAKQQAQLNAEQQEIENQRAIAKAEADAEVKKKGAQAEAEAKLIAAKAQAEANALLEKSLTSQILQEKYIDKWNGQLPNVVSGKDDTSIMIQPSANN